MVLRILFRYLANNEQLVQKLSESYPMRRMAQFLVSQYYKTKNIAEQHKLDELTPERLRSFFAAFKKNVKQEIEGAKQELKKKN